MSRQETLLGSDDPPVFEYHKGAFPNILFTADHAGTHIPAKLNNLDCDIDFANTHIGCDPGIKELAEEIAQRNGEIIITNYSRAVIDPTRMPDSPHLIIPVSDGTAIPGNQNASEKQKQQRFNEIYKPYHDKLDELVTAHKIKNPKTFIVPVHSMEKRLTIDSTGKKAEDRDRPETGFIYREPDDALAEIIAEILRKKGITDIGMNYPYSGKDKSYKFPTFERHQTRLPYIVWEIRNDLLRTPKQVTFWADVIFSVLKEIMTNHTDIITPRNPEDFHS